MVAAVDTELVARYSHYRRGLAFLEFEDRPSPRRFRDELALLDANLKSDRIDTAVGSHDAEIACAVLTLVDDFHLYRRVGRPSQLGQNIGEREAFERRVVKFSDEIARRHAGLGCGAARVGLLILRPSCSMATNASIPSHPVLPSARPCLSRELTESPKS